MGLKELMYEATRQAEDAMEREQFLLQTVWETPLPELDLLSEEEGLNVPLNPLEA